MNKYLKIFILAFCCFVYQNVNAQCTADISATTSNNYNTTFDGAPCDDGGVCPVNELTASEILAQEGYTVDNVVAGVTYTVSACNSAAGAGMGGQAWPLDFTIYAPSGAIDAFGLDSGSTCELTFTATESGTYVLGIYEANACGTSTNTAAGSENGFISMTCVGTAPACPVAPTPPCNAGEIISGFDMLTVCPGEPFTLDVVGDTITSGGYNVFFSDTEQNDGVTQTGSGGIAGGFNITGIGSLPYVSNETLNGLIGPGSQNPQFDVLSGTWYLFGVALNESGEACSATATGVAVTFLDASDAACQGDTPVCDANPDAPTSAPVCGGTDTPATVNFGGACALDSNVDAGNQAGFSIFYETDGTEFVDAGANGTVYATGAEILANLNTDNAGETNFFGSFGDCSGIDAAATFTNPALTPFTLDVYIVPVEASGDGTVLAIDGDCPVTVVTLTVNPNAPEVVATEGTCDVDGTATVGYDLDDGAGGGPNGVIDAEEGDIVITTLTVDSDDLLQYPCGGAGTQADSTITAAELETALGVAAGSGCYTDITVSAVCPSPECPPCDATAAVLSVSNETCTDGSTGPVILSEDVVGTGGTTQYVVTDADGSITGTADVIINVGSLQEASDIISALGVEESACITAMTFDQPGLDVIVADLNTCTGGLAGDLLNLPETGNTFEIVFEAIVEFSAPDNPGLTIAGVEALIGGGGGGPGLGGLADLSALLPGLECPVAPFCYQLSNTACATGAEDCPPDVSGCTDATACNFDAAATVDDGSCILATGCDVCDGAGGVTDNPEVGTTCDDGDATTVGDVILADCTCAGLTAPGCTDATACNFDAAATLDDGTCVFATGCDVCDGAGGVTDNPEAGEACDDGDAGTENDTVQVDCSCLGTPVMVDVEGCTDATACNFDAAATVDDGTCVFAIGCDVCDGAGGVTDNPEAGEACDDGDAGTENDMVQVDCTCLGTPVMVDVEGCTDATACNFDAAATVDDGTCVFATGCDVCDGAGGVTDNPEAGEACDDGDAGTENDMVQVDCTCSGTPVMVDVEGCTDATACNFDAAATVDDGTCVFAIGCDVCDGAGGVTDNPEAGEACDDGDAGTENDMVQVDCTCSGTPVMVDVEGCTDATACNFDAAATVDDGTCVFAIGCDVCDGAGGVTDNPEAGDACDDGDATTENDTILADCTCAGTPIDTSDPIDLDTADPCGCVGLDLDGDASNGNEISQETITIIPGLAPYSVLSVVGLVDATGTTLDATAIEAIIAASADGLTILAYVPTDGSTYSLTIQDANGSMATQNGGPCPACAPDVEGCTDATACNFDAAATVDDGTCILPGDSCNDGNPLTVNDTVQADCSCAGTDSGEAIPTVGQWGLIILALLMLNLGVLYIRQTEITIISE